MQGEQRAFFKTLHVSRLCSFCLCSSGTHNDQADRDAFCCRVGSLVWGTVRRVQDFGAFIGFDDTRASGLVHISNISRQHVGYTDVSTASECCRLLCTAA